MSGPPPHQHRFAWWLVGVLFLGSVLNYVDRAVLGIVMPQMRRDLALSYTDYGLAVNSFLVLYAIFYILGGRLADRLGCRRTFSVTVIFWSLANMAHAAARGLGSLCLFRALLGIGEGGYYPTAMRGAAEWFPPEHRAKAVGILLCGISLGMLLTPPIVAWITYHYGWGAAFLVTGALGFFLIPAWLVLHGRIRRVYGVPDPAPAFAAVAAGDPAAEGELTLSEALRRRKYWLILAARSLTDSAWYFYLFWMPGYFQEVRGFDLKTVGQLLWIPYLASDAGALGGAWASSYLIQRGLGLDRGRKAILVPGAMLGLCSLLVYYVSSAALALALVSLALLGHLAWSTNIHTVITEITPARHVAVLYGITGAAGILMGAACQPVLGRLIDRMGYSPGFLYAGGVYALAIALLLSAGRIEKMRRG